MVKHLSMILSKEDNLKFEEIYNTYRQTMFSVANRIIKDQYLSEDIIQRAFIRIISNLDKINEVNSHQTKGFVIIIVQNIAIDFYRKRKKENNVSLDTIEMYVEKLESKEISGTTDLEEAISKLPIKYANVLRLRFIYEYSYIDIAEILNTTESNVRQRVSRSKKKLKESLNKEYKLDDL